MISEDPLNTGKFFGEIDGTILKSLEQNKVFKKKMLNYCQSNTHMTSVTLGKILVVVKSFVTKNVLK